MISETQLLPADAVSLWRRRNDAERRVREAIDRTAGLTVFGTGFDFSGDGGGEFFVTLTAADEAAKQAATDLLNGSSGLDKIEWDHGWRRFKLGDWMIRLYPERGAD